MDQSSQGRGRGGGFHDSASRRVRGDDGADDDSVMCQQRQKNSCSKHPKSKTTAGSRVLGLQRLPEWRVIKSSCQLGHFSSKQLQKSATTAKKQLEQELRGEMLPPSGNTPPAPPF